MGSPDLNDVSHRWGRVHTCASYAVSKSEFNSEKENFVKALEELKDDKNLVKLFSSISTNKNGSITKNRRNALLNFGAVRDYGNSYGSHSYTIDSFMLTRDSDFCGTLSLNSYKEQSSF